MEQPTDPLTVRLVALAAALDLSGLGPRVEEAVSLAVDLLVAGRDTPATATVAGLGAGATLRDSVDAIRAMLREHGAAPPPPAPGEAAGYSTALWAVGRGGLSVGEFDAVFYTYLPPWREQSALQRRLVVLLNDWEVESDLAAREPIARAIRAAAAEAVGHDPAA
jgi:hypothetical protein